jgi:V8-like Glu-specific endopeptidase
MVATEFEVLGELEEELEQEALELEPLSSRREPITQRWSSAGEFEIFPPDDRRLVRNTLLAPYRFVCCLEIAFVNPLNDQTLPLRGTGTLVSDRHVLTAAHVVFEDFSPQRPHFPVSYLRAQDIRVAPGRNDRVLPFPFTGATNVRVAPGWQSTANRQAALGNKSHLVADPQADFALLTLANPLGALGTAVTEMAPGTGPLGYWGHPQRGQGTRIRPIELKWLRNQPVNTVGYPVDKCRTRPSVGSATAAEIAACQHTIPDQPEFHDQGSTQWVSTGRVVNPAPADMPGMITYMANMQQGQSGGPVWLNWQGFRNLVAINTGGFPSPTPPFPIVANMGVRITEPVLELLRRWMRADGVSATF